MSLISPICQRYVANISRQIEKGRKEGRGRTVIWGGGRAGDGEGEDNGKSGEEQRLGWRGYPFKEPFTSTISGKDVVQCLKCPFTSPFFSCYPSYEYIYECKINEIISFVCI